MVRKQRTSRALSWVAALLGFCVLVWLIREQGLPDHERLPVYDQHAEGAGELSPSLESISEHAVAPLPQPASFGGPAASTDGDPASSASGAQTEEVTPIEDARISSTSIEVTLDVPAAWLKPPGMIYALRAGAPGVNERDAVPHTTPTGERSTLYLPAAGLWDIGYSCSSGSTLLEDVRVPKTEEVRLVADVRPLHFRTAAADVAKAEGIRVGFRATGDDAPDFPGRGQSRTGTRYATLDASGQAESIALPAGVPYRIRALDVKNRHGSLEWVPDPPSAQAGDAVVLRAIKRGTLVVKLSLGEALPATWVEHWKTDLWTAAYVVPEGGGEDDQRYESTYLQKDGSFKNSELRFAIPPGRYTMKSGVGQAYHDQSEQVEVRAGEVTQRSVTLIPDSSFALFGSQQVAWGFHLQLELQNGTDEKARIFVSTTNHGEPEVEHHSGRPGDDPLEIMSTNPPGVLQVFQPPYGVSKPLSMPDRGSLDVPLRSGGLLVVVPDMEPARALGRLTIQRPDGALIPFFKLKEGGPLSADQMELENTLPAQTGLRIGPLLPGRHVFDIRLGGVRIGRAEAVVVAGRSTPLPLAVHGALAPR